MKKYLLHILGIISFFPNYALDSSEKLAAALKEAWWAVTRLKLEEDDLRHLSEYFEFYASWYAAVTPASKELYDSLSRQALEFIEKIKKIAKPLERKHDRRLLGASRLSESGKYFYRKVIEMLRKKNYASRACIAQSGQREIVMRIAF